MGILTRTFAVYTARKKHAYLFLLLINFKTILRGKCHWKFSEKNLFYVNRYWKRARLILLIDSFSENFQSFPFKRMVVLTRMFAYRCSASSYRRHGLCKLLWTYRPMIFVIWIKDLFTMRWFHWQFFVTFESNQPHLFLET